MLIVNRLFERNITRKDFNTLAPKKWVSETVIDCMFELLTLKSHIHAAHNSMKKPDYFVQIAFAEMAIYENLNLATAPDYLKGQFFKSEPFNNPEKYDKIFIPMCANIQRTHFALLVLHHDRKEMHYIDSQPDYDITDIEKTREYKVKQILCILNKEYEEYKLLNDLNGLPDICPHGYQDNNYDCGLFTILHAEHISQKGIKDLNKKVKQSTISSKKIRNKIYSVLATYQKKDFQYFYER